MRNHVALLALKVGRKLRIDFMHVAQEFPSTSDESSVLRFGAIEERNEDHAIRLISNMILDTASC